MEVGWERFHGPMAIRGHASRARTHDIELTSRAEIMYKAININLADIAEILRPSHTEATV